MWADIILHKLLGETTTEILQILQRRMEKGQRCVSGTTGIRMVMNSWKDDMYNRWPVTMKNEDNVWKL